MLDCFYEYLLMTIIAILSPFNDKHVVEIILCNCRPIHHSLDLIMIVRFLMYAERIICENLELGSMDRDYEKSKFHLRN